MCINILFVYIYIDTDLFFFPMLCPFLGEEAEEGNYMGLHQILVDTISRYSLCTTPKFL